MANRENEILIASTNWTDEVLTECEKTAFQEGAKWADRTLIKKVEQWLIKKGRHQMIGSLYRFLEEE